MKDKNFEYDSELDNFCIYSNKDKEDIQGSIAMGNFVYDIGSSGKVVGLEIDNASQIFDVSPILFKNAEDAKLSVSLGNNMLLLKFSILLGKKEFVYTSIVPQDKLSIVA